MWTFCHHRIWFADSYGLFSFLYWNLSKNWTLLKSPHKSSWEFYEAITPNKPNLLWHHCKLQNSIPVSIHFMVCAISSLLQIVIYCISNLFLKILLFIEMALSHEVVSEWVWNSFRLEEGNIPPPPLCYENSNRKKVVIFIGS